MSLDIYLDAPAVDTGAEHPYCADLYSANITHNLGAMADEAGLYKPLWRPDENGITVAGQLIEPLKAGIAAMKAEPARFKKLEPENKWGTFTAFLPWLENLLDACERHPKATVRVSR